MKLWQGRIQADTDAQVNSFNTSLPFDQRMYRADITGSMAHAKMLAAQGIITGEDAESILAGLSAILEDIESGVLNFDNDSEDIHMYVEEELTKRIGDPGKRLHTARSRNDQVALEDNQNLREELMVGQAYISAYTLESKVKSSSILMEKEVRNDIITHFGTTKYIVDATEKEGIYALRWADIAYLQNWGVMEHFVKLANASGWKPHYYNTLYSFLRKSPGEARRRDVFRSILKLASMNEAGESDARSWHKQDEFIRNAFAPEVDSNFQKMMLTFLRQAALEQKE